MMSEPGYEAKSVSYSVRSRGAELGMWVFLATEVLFFGGLMLAYLVYRIRFPEAFWDASDHLDRLLGGFNTAVLLTSSLTMALADRARELQRVRLLEWHLGLTAALGTVFLIVKAVEWGQERAAQLMPLRTLPFDVNEDQGRQTEMFFNLYFAATGLHALHLLIGILLVLAVMASASRVSVARVRVTGLYWHFVDIVWIFLYPIFYLVR